MAWRQGSRRARRAACGMARARDGGSPGRGVSRKERGSVARQGACLGRVCMGRRPAWRSCHGSARHGQRRRLHLLSPCHRQGSHRHPSAGNPHEALLCQGCWPQHRDRHRGLTAKPPGHGGHEHRWVRKQRLDAQGQLSGARASLVPGIARRVGAHNDTCMLGRRERDIARPANARPPALANNVSRGGSHRERADARHESTTHGGKRRTDRSCSHFRPQSVRGRRAGELCKRCCQLRRACCSRASTSARKRRRSSSRCHRSGGARRARSACQRRGRASQQVKAAITICSADPADGAPAT